MKIKVAPAGAKCHPSKVAVFSAEDIPLAENPLSDLVALRTAVEVNGEFMKMWVSPIVPKGSFFVVDQSKVSSTWPSKEKK